MELGYTSLEKSVLDVVHDDGGEQTSEVCVTLGCFWCIPTMANVIVDNHDGVALPFRPRRR